MDPDTRTLTGRHTALVFGRHLCSLGQVTYDPQSPAAQRGETVELHTVAAITDSRAFIKYPSHRHAELSVRVASQGCGLRNRESETLRFEIVEKCDCHLAGFHVLGKACY